MKRRELLKRLAAISMAATMVVATGCGAEQTATTTPAPATPAPAAEATPAPEAEAPAEEDGPEVKKDANGNPIDLGGMHVIVRDWWSHAVGDPEAEPTNAYEEARRDYLDWAQETYNFTIEQAGISGWGSTPEDYNNYAISGGDDQNYVFILRPGMEAIEAMSNGLMYDLATLDCLDFSEPKWNMTKVHEAYTKGDHIYAMSAETPEPTMGMYFNKRLLKEAGIDPNLPYELQEKGEWTWAKFEELCETIQKDKDNDGVIDQYACVFFTADFYNGAVASNAAHFINKNKDGYFNALETQETIDALNWALDMIDKYQYPQPEGTEWDYWVEGFQTGKGAFVAGGTYQAGGEWKDMVDDFGFVCLPKGPNAKDYTNWLTPNPFAIPSCYDADRAWKIAFAYNVYSDPVPGFEDYNGRLSGFRNNFRDNESVDLTIVRMSSNGSSTYHGWVPGVDMGPQLIWGLSKDNTPAQAAEAIRDEWQSYIDEANK